ncbi:MAG: glycogen debranching protein GlgX [Actinomycetales bacterium]|nr:glycogen debranching protein GlgX [Actinomycetales bacterium]
MSSGIQLGLPDPQGATVRDGGTNFAIWAPDAIRVELCLINEDGSYWTFDLPGFTKGIYHGFLPDVGPGQQYGYRVHGEWAPERGMRFNPAKLLVDPYAKAVTGDLILNEAIYGHVANDDLIFNAQDSRPYVPRSVVVDTSYDWEDDQRPNIAPEHTIIYETHVAGLTGKHPSIPPEQRGTFAGMTHPDVIAYLKDLGITTVELLPVQQFVSEPFLLAQGKENYWGYNTLAFFAPHHKYSSAGSLGHQVTEFKDMIKAYHRAGLEVILDVVYNHTPEQNELGPTLSLRGLDNKGYYHLTADNRHNVDFTGCGNSIRASHQQTLRLLMDSLRYWVTEMHVDGFRFDLASELTRNSQKEIDFEGGFISATAQSSTLKNVKLIAEPWDIGPNGYQVGSFPEPWSEWNDQFRDTIRDFWRGMSGGVAELGWRLTGSADLYWDQMNGPRASINFVTAHDGFTLHDLVSYNDKHNLANGEENRDGADTNRSWNCGIEGETDDPTILALRRRQMRNFIATTFLSAGTPMLLGGDEVGRSQQGNNNAYCQNNDIAWNHWKFTAEQQNLYDFVRHVIRIRQEHTVFQRNGYLSGENVNFMNVPDLAWLRADGELFSPEDWESPNTRQIGMYLAGAVKSQSRHDIVDNGFYWFLNSSAEDVEVTLPNGEYASEYLLRFNTVDELHWQGQEPISANSKVTLAPWSCALWMVTKRD